MTVTSLEMENERIEIKYREKKVNKKEWEIKSSQLVPFCLRVEAITGCHPLNGSYQLLMRHPTSVRCDSKMAATCDGSKQLDFASGWEQGTQGREKRKGKRKKKEIIPTCLSESLWTHTDRGREGALDIYQIYEERMKETKKQKNNDV